MAVTSAIKAMRDKEYPEQDSQPGMLVYLLPYLAGLMGARKTRVQEIRQAQTLWTIPPMQEIAAGPQHDASYVAITLGNVKTAF